MIYEPTWGAVVFMGLLASPAILAGAAGFIYALYKFFVPKRTGNLEGYTNFADWYVK